MVEKTAEGSEVRLVANGNTTGFACLAASLNVFASGVTIVSCNLDQANWLYDENVGTFSIPGPKPGKRLCLDAGTDISYLNCQQPPLNAHTYCNPNVGAEERAKDLVSRLKLEEK